MGRAEEERRRPRPPVRVKRRKVRVVRGAWRRGILGERADIGFIGKILRRRIGRRAMKAIIWWGEVKALDY
jgi:hypothetical protein